VEQRCHDGNLKQPKRASVAVIAVAILFIIWQNIGKCAQDHSGSSSSSSTATYLAVGSDGVHSNLVVHADCHSANKGLFAGLIVLAGSIVSIILFCIAMADK
jgi:presenilin-like A22 family membrane protease